MRARRAKIVIAAAAFILLALGAPTASAITKPPGGAIVNSPPLLNWPGVSGAVRYNVQLYRQTAGANRKILSRWPARSRFQLHWKWHYKGRARHFSAARYFWYVWPWLGSRYGDRRVGRKFVYGRPPVNTSPPTVAGEGREGATLTASPGTWTGLPRPTLSYRWKRCPADGSACARITDASLPSYRVGTEDIDQAIKVVVVAKNIARTVKAPSVPSAVVLPAPPNNVSRPGIAGHPHVGATLTASTGNWLSSRPVTYSYRWLRCSRDHTSCAQINGATERRYQVRAADEAHRLSVVVRAANSGGANKATSSQSAVVGLVLGGTSAADSIRGTLGSDVIWARAGNDTVYGGRGNDRIYGGGGSDHVYGGPGADVIIVRDEVRDWVDCGAGEDTVQADRLDRVNSSCEHVTRG